MSARVAILGGGVSGLASAHQLAKRGYHVTLFEGDGQLGGLGSAFEHAGVSLERFYHCLLPGDAALLRLLGEIGIAKDLVWRDVGMGFRVGPRTYPLNGPLDLLRFSPLSFLDRLRLGRMGLRARATGDDPGLDSISVRDWIVSLAGERVYERLFRPMLESKLGEAAGEIPALWLASRIQREKSSNTEVKGYYPGGYRAIVAAIEASLRARGVAIRTRTPVEGLAREGKGVVVAAGGESERFDAAVAALPLVEVQRIAAALPLDPRVASLQLDYQGVVNAVFLLRRPLTPYYWLPIMDCGVTAQGLVETSNLVPPERTAGLHVAYLLNYTHRASALYRKADAELLDLYERDLFALFPEARGAVEARYLFRAPFVEPIWPLRFRSMRPPAEAVPGLLYLASTAQVYPKINAWNSCCEVAEDAAAALVARHSQRTPAVPAGARP